VRIYEDLRGVQARIGHVQILVLTAVALLTASFWYIQVLRGRYYRDLAENNRTRVVRIAAPRGVLLDRHGRLLVENRASFNVLLTPEHSPDLDGSIERIAAALGIGEAQVRERLARRAPFRPLVVRADAPLEDVAVLEARRLELPEASIEVVPLRSYPLGSSAAHALGRVGEVTERQLRSPQFAELTPGDLVGQAGIEAAYNASLMGRDGYRKVVVNSRGLEVSEDERVPPQVGPRMTLTLDAELQRAVDLAFAGRAGTAVALDPETGEILAMASTPAYDPNAFTTGIDAALWAQLATDPETPLMNRVIQAQYAPGSTFKIVMAIGALEEGLITPATTFYCPGYLAVYGTVFRCHKAAGHGVVNLHTALAKSCNVFFYQVGIRMEIERIARWAKRLGLGAPTGVDLPHEAAGLVPSPEWKLRAQRAPWFAGETVSVAIGQGQLTVTPLQLARLAAVVANRGRLVQPHLVLAVGERNAARPPVTSVGLRPQTLAALLDGMRAVVNEQGTASRARLPGLAVCGKTGSAQVVGRARLVKSGQAPALLPHGWFVGFAPADHPRIALAVLVEHGGSGSEAAAPIARRILASFFGVAAEGAASVAMRPAAPAPGPLPAPDTPRTTSPGDRSGRAGREP
jgi:penicillin-binding protein 2